MDTQTAPTTVRLGFIGGGKLAGSVIRGLVRARYCPPEAILVSEPHDVTRRRLEEELGIIGAADNAEVAERAEIILVGVKPAVVLPMLAEIAPQLERKLIISLAAGVRLHSMEKAAAAHFMRAMTNTPSAVCRAATALTRGERTTNGELSIARELFSAVGAVVEVAEDQIDAVTALAGSGPAFVYTVIEGLARGGEKMGLGPDVALTLATQTVFGAAQLATETKLSPEELRSRIFLGHFSPAPGGSFNRRH